MKVGQLIFLYYLACLENNLNKSACIKEQSKTVNSYWNRTGCNSCYSYLILKIRATVVPVYIHKIYAELNDYFIINVLVS